MQEGSLKEVILNNLERWQEFTNLIKWETHSRLRKQRVPRARKRSSDRWVSNAEHLTHPVCASIHPSSYAPSSLQYCARSQEHNDELSAL